MKQALEHIVALVDRINIRSSSSDVQSILRLIAETAQKALENPTVLLNSLPTQDVQRFENTNVAKDGVSNRSVIDAFHAITVPLTGKEAITSQSVNLLREHF